MLKSIFLNLLIDILKKLFAILLLFIYLFNLVGYNLLFQYLINRNDAQVSARLDKNNYVDKDLVVVKVALNMPYLTSSNEFVRTDGAVVLNGIHYNYVKTKVSDDTLYLMCLPDFLKTSLYNAKTDIAKQSADLPTGKKNAETFPVKKICDLSEYSYTSEQSLLSSRYSSPYSYKDFIYTALSSVFIKYPAQPPEQTC